MPSSTTIWHTDTTIDLEVNENIVRKTSGIADSARVDLVSPEER